MKRDTRKLSESGWMGDMSRGASMGRGSVCHTGNYEGAEHPKLSLQRVHINSGGYDSGGAYWGHGEALWWCGDDNGDIDMFFRARNRDAAKQYVLEEIPEARFYR